MISKENLDRITYLWTRWKTHFGLSRSSHRDEFVAEIEKFFPYCFQLWVDGPDDVEQDELLATAEDWCAEVFGKTDEGSTWIHMPTALNFWFETEECAVMFKMKYDDYIVMIGHYTHWD